MSDTQSTIADRVRGIAAEKRLTQKSIAGILRISRTSVADRMSGKLAWTATEIFTLAQATGTPVSRFFPDVTVAVAA